MGSKARHGKEILDAIMEHLHFPNSRYNWVEPFVGGANMIDKVSKTANRYGNDNNKYLIALLKELQDGFIPPDYVTEDEYKALRLDSKLDNHPQNHMAMIGFVGIGCSYSGKWFGGFARNIRKDAPDAEKLNMTTRNYCAESKRNMMRQVPNIQGVTFTYGDYREMEIPECDTIIYCDPPYAGTTKYKDNFDHDTFWKWCDRQVVKGHKVFVSEYNAPEGWKCIWEKQVNNSLTKDTGSKKGIEKLFTK